MKIVKIPLNAGALSKKSGQEKSPDKIIDNLKNFFLKESGVLPFHTIEELKLDNSDLEGCHDAIYKKVSEMSSPAILVGGDHSLTYPAFKAFSKMHENPGLLVFDAHLDAENDFSPPTHEDYLRMLVSDGILKRENVIVVGVRNFHQNELEFWKKNRIKVFTMAEIAKEGKSEIADAVMSVAKNFSGLYISVDIDVLDPAFAPGTGYLEPGGMTTRELLYFVQRLKNLKNIMMWDIVEVNPDKDLNDITSSAAAKIVLEMS
ncbi:MAG: arginase family protein [archaeon]